MDQLVFDETMLPERAHGIELSIVTMKRSICTASESKWKLTVWGMSSCASHALHTLVHSARTLLTMIHVSLRRRQFINWFKIVKIIFRNSERVLKRVDTWATLRKGYTVSESLIIFWNLFNRKLKVKLWSIALFLN